MPDTYQDVILGADGNAVADRAGAEGRWTVSLWLAVLLIWCALSVVLGLLIGRLFPHEEDLP